MLLAQLGTGGASFNGMTGEDTALDTPWRKRLLQVGKTLLLSGKALLLLEVSGVGLGQGLGEPWHMGDSERKVFLFLRFNL